MGKYTQLVENATTLSEEKGSKEEWELYRKALNISGDKVVHLHPKMGLVYCPDCPAYGGKLKNITPNTELSEMFCKKGFSEVINHLKTFKVEK